MSSYTKRIAKKFEFDGDTVEVVMSRLKRKDALKLSPYMREEDESGEVKLTLDEKFNMMDVGAYLVQKNVINLRGLFIEGEELVKMGNSITNEELWETVFSDVYFINLLSDLLNFLTEKSFMSKDKVKNSSRPSEDTSAATELTETCASEDSPPSSGLTPIDTATESVSAERAPID